MNPTILLTIVYVMLNFLSPVEIVPSLAPFHVMVVLGGITGFAAVVTLLLRPALLRSKQLLLALMFTVAVMISLVATGWAGGALFALQMFGPVVACLIFVLASADSVKKIKIIMFALISVSLILVVQSGMAYYFNYREEELVVREWSGVLEQLSGSGPSLRRVRAFGFLSDPNDLAQQFIVIMPFIALFWRKRSPFSNLVLVILPLVTLVCGIYLTRSRGAIIGLAVLFLLAARSRMKTGSAVLLTVASVAVAILLNFGGGRALSMSEGSASGRGEAWSEGLSMWRQHPIFGVGFGRFMDYYRQTAHNSFVLCFSETGIVGYFIWMCLLVFTFIELSAMTKMPVMEGDQAATDRRRFANAAFLSLATYLATGWFLSRTYTPSLYMILGLSAAIIALERAQPNSVIPRFRPSWLTRTAVWSVGLFLAVYLLVRYRWAS